MDVGSKDPDCHGDTVRGERASGHNFNVLGGQLFDVWKFHVECTEIGFEVEWVSRETSDKEWTFALHDGMRSTVCVECVFLASRWVPQGKFRQVKDLRASQAASPRADVCLSPGELVERSGKVQTFSFPQSATTALSVSTASSWGVPI